MSHDIIERGVLLPLAHVVSIDEEIIHRLGDGGEQWGGPHHRNGGCALWCMAARFFLSPSVLPPAGSIRRQ
jgi:hypothetical protein